MKFKKIADKKYEIINNGQLIGIVEQRENEYFWMATSTTNKNMNAFRETRKRAADSLIWLMEREETK